MSRVLFLCVTQRDKREIARLPYRPEYIFHDYATDALEHMLIEHRHADTVSDPLKECERLTREYAGVDAVISTDDYPGSTLAAIVATQLGLPSPSPAANLIAQHKYECRRVQQISVPDAAPAVAPIDTVGAFTPPDRLAPPIFVKPIKSFFSIGAQRINAWSEIEPMRHWWSQRGDFFAPFDRLLRTFTPYSVGTRRLLAEGLLRGVQVTVEGYAAGGEIHVFGVVDSVMFPGTIIFQRFEYPSSLPDEVQRRMATIAETIIRAIGYDNGMFNIEMMYDAESAAVHIIEINPRMASQFGDLYEKVDGLNSYQVMLDIALGRAPHMPYRRGTYAVAASCVLRTFQDHEVTSVPTPAEIEELDRDHPGIRVEHFCAPGERLSDTMQDGNSFRYGLIHLGGRDRDDILQAQADCERRLTFGLKPVG